jgi:O-antigen/teichoic acid export membrane protein
MLLSIASINGPVFKAIGKPNVIFYTSIVHQMILAASLFLLKGYGVEGIAYAVVTPMVVSTIIAFWLIKVYLDAEYKEILNPILKTGYAATMMLLVVKASQYCLGLIVSIPNYMYLALSICIGVISYIVFLNIFNRNSLYNFKNNLSKIFAAKKVFVRTTN